MFCERSTQAAVVKLRLGAVAAPKDVNGPVAGSDLAHDRLLERSGAAAEPNQVVTIPCVLVVGTRAAGHADIAEDVELAFEFWVPIAPLAVAPGNRHVQKVLNLFPCVSASNRECHAPP